MSVTHLETDWEPDAAGAVHDVVLGVLPLFHSLAQMANLLLPFAVGARVVYLETLNSTDLVRALAERKIDVRILDYAEHALTEGDDSLAASYIECEIDDRVLWGAGIDPSITTSSLKAIVSAVNRAERDKH